MLHRLAPLLAFCLLAAPASAGQVLTTPVLPSVDNFRDVAGVAAAYGGTGVADMAGQGALRPGVVYRANALALSPADEAALARLGVSEDIDLRTPAEISKHPDHLPPGVAFVEVNILGTPGLPPFSLSSTAAADAQMQGFYRDFVTSPVERQAFRTALLDVAAAKKPVVFHCSAGKDRSGWLAALLQSIAGVNQADIMRDYLASNTYEAVSIRATLGKLPPAQRPAYAELLGVKADFLNAALGAAAQNYGGVDGYVTKGLGLTPAQLAALRAKLVEN